jgi:hypothetical protein
VPAGAWWRKIGEAVWYESGLKEVGGDQVVTPARQNAYRFFAAFFLAAFFAFFAILPPK